MMTVSSLRACGWCGNALHGRLDKRFCSDNCRALFHKDQLRSGHPAVREVWKILLHNHRVLSRFAGRDVPFSFLLGAGFRPEYFTHVGNEKDDPGLTCCFDFGYRTKGERVEIVAVSIPGFGG